MMTRLSVRELEVLKLLALGFTREAIASDLGRDKKTINAHVRNLAGKLGVEIKELETSERAQQLLELQDSDDLEPEESFLISPVPPKRERPSWLVPVLTFVAGVGLTLATVQATASPRSAPPGRTFNFEQDLPVAIATVTPAPANEDDDEDLPTCDPCPVFQTVAFTYHPEW